MTRLGWWLENLRSPVLIIKCTGLDSGGTVVDILFDLPVEDHKVKLKFAVGVATSAK